MTPEAIDALIERYREGFRRLDAEALADNHVPNGTYESPAHGKLQGRSAIEGVYRYWFTAFPDLTIEFDEIVKDADSVAVFWTFKGTQKGRFFGLPETASGKRVEMKGATLYRLNEHGIQHVQQIFDFTGVLVKAGILKVKPL